MTHADNRIGEPYLKVDPAKVIAVVETHGSDRDNVFNAPDADSNLIASAIIDFLTHEMQAGRLPKQMLPIQSGVGNVANAVLAGLLHGPFEQLLGFTEVLQDGMLDLLRAGKMSRASATAISLSAQAFEDFEKNIDFYRSRIILRPQEISNHPELVRRLGVIAMNSMIEADIYGNINSTHLMGSEHDERHRRQRRLCAQRLFVVLRHAVGGQGRQDQLHRAHVLARRPHRARHANHRHRTGPGRPARPLPQATRQGGD